MKDVFYMIVSIYHLHVIDFHSKKMSDENLQSNSYMKD